MLSLYAVQIEQQQLTCSQADSIFSGISTFGRLPYSPCLKSKADFDIAFIGKTPIICSTSLVTKYYQVLPSTLAHRTAQVLALALAALDKVLAASISSMSPQATTAYFWSAWA